MLSKERISEETPAGKREENLIAKKCNKVALTSVIKSHFAAKEKIFKYFN